MRPTDVPGRPVAALADRLGVAAAAGPILTGVTLDSRRVRPGDLYAALPGQRTHGAAYAEQARSAGAAAVLTDPAGAALARDSGLPLLVVPDPRAVLGDTAAWIYGDPTRHLDVVGITGTNGKTTTAYLLEAAVRAAGQPTGLIGTVETVVAGRAVASARTTPEAPDLQALFAVMRERGVRTVAMEVSSHALALHRVDGTRFAVGAFTNLSQDHLDFHGTLEDYFRTKARLFDGRTDHRVVVVDDAWGRRLVTPGAVTVSAAGAPDAAWRATDIRSRPLGVEFVITGPGFGPRPVALQLPGAFNAANATLAVASLAALGMDPAVAVAGVAALPFVPGRVERVDAGQDFLAVVDYAHTPDAVATLVAAMRTVTAGRLVVVLGCGGDRDAEKRPLMGAAAAGADVVVVTDDNPRSEDPATIRAAVLAGARGAATGAEVVEVGDRRAAIATAVRRAGRGDTVVVAGKGHEQGQDVGGVVTPFDDRVVTREAIAAARGRGDDVGEDL